MGNKPLKRAWNLSVNAQLKHLMRVQCAAEERTESEVTEQLYREYLASKGVRIQEQPNSHPSPSPAPRQPVRYTKGRSKGKK